MKWRGRVYLDNLRRIVFDCVCHEHYQTKTQEEWDEFVKNNEELRDSGWAFIYVEVDDNEV